MKKFKIIFFAVAIGILLIFPYIYYDRNIKYDPLDTEAEPFIGIDIPSNYIDILKNSNTLFFYTADGYGYSDVYVITEEPEYAVIKYQFSYIYDPTTDLSFLNHKHELRGCYKQKISKDRYKYLTGLAKKMCKSYNDNAYNRESCDATRISVKSGKSIAVFDWGYILDGEIFYGFDGDYPVNLYDRKYIYVHKFVRDFIINSQAYPQFYRVDSIKLLDRPEDRVEKIMAERSLEKTIEAWKLDQTGGSHMTAIVYKGDKNSEKKTFFIISFLIIALLIYCIISVYNKPYVIGIAPKGNYPETITFALYKNHTLKVTIHNQHPVLLKCASADAIDSSYTNIQDIYQPVIYHIPIDSDGGFFPVLYNNKTKKSLSYDFSDSNLDRENGQTLREQYGLPDEIKILKEDSFKLSDEEYNYLVNCITRITQCPPKLNVFLHNPTPGVVDDGGLTDKGVKFLYYDGKTYGALTADTVKTSGKDLYLSSVEVYLINYIADRMQYRFAPCWDEEIALCKNKMKTYYKTKSMLEENLESINYLISEVPQKGLRVIELDKIPDEKKAKKIKAIYDKLGIKSVIEIDWEADRGIYSISFEKTDDDYYGEVYIYKNYSVIDDLGNSDIGNVYVTDYCSLY